MFCPKCGTQVSDNTFYCDHCGASMNDAREAQAGITPAPESTMPMKWFKFLIYFSLFASALLNTISGISLITGAAYGGVKEVVYNTFDGLQVWDVIIGLAMLGLAAFAIYTRIRLAGYYANGPKLLTWMYLASLIVNLVYTVGVYVLVPEITGQMDLSSTISSGIGSVVMVCINRVYFQKRAEYFVN